MLGEGVLRLVEHVSLVDYLPLLLEVELYQLDRTALMVGYLHLGEERSVDWDWAGAM